LEKSQKYMLNLVFKTAQYTSIWVFLLAYLTSYLSLDHWKVLKVKFLLYFVEFHALFFYSNGISSIFVLLDLFELSKKYINCFGCVVIRFMLEKRVKMSYQKDSKKKAIKRVPKEPRKMLKSFVYDHYH